MNSKEGGAPLSILLADDDSDDRYLFYKALKEIPLTTELRTVTNGDELMDFLYKNAVNLPDVLFLDLSMPRKTGFECLMEIKDDKKLKALSVVMFTTSFSRGVEIEQNLSIKLSGMGAQDYIRKPAGFENLKTTIHEALIRVIEKARLTEGKKNL